jgi:Kef-type K+ transport system membrane component KefB
VQPDLGSLVVVGVVAVLAPILVDLPRTVRAPLVVAEIGLGIIIGPDVLDLAKMDPYLEFLAGVGLALLFFLAGLELDLDVIRGHPLRIAVVGWALSVLIAAAAALVVVESGLVDDAVPLAIALCTTALGTLVPILRDAGELKGGFGTLILAIGSAGEFGPVVLISVFLTAQHGTVAAFVLVGIFFALAVGAAAIVLHVHPARIQRVIHRTMHATGQLGVRLAIVTLLVLVFLAEEFGLDIALGAFVAGLVVGLVLPRGQSDPVRVSLEGIGYGLFVPIFFITSGITFDLHALLSDWSTLALVPLFLGLFLVVRGTPALLAVQDVGRTGITPLALFSATALPLVVAVTELAVDKGELSPKVAAALVGAGMVSVLVFPLAGLALRKRSAARTDASASPG